MGLLKWKRLIRTIPLRLQSLDKTPPPLVPQSIFLEGSLSHDSQILVADSETHTEQFVDDEYDGTEDEPAVSWTIIIY